jgi:ATP-binding cassette, subfamily B, bacterial
MKRTVRSYLKPYRFALLMALGQVFLISALELLKPWPLKIVIDNVLVGEPLAWGFALQWSSETLLLAACGGVILVYLLSGGMTILYNYTSVSIGQSMVNDLRADLYGHLQRLSLSFYSRQKVGDLLYRVTADTQAIQTLTMNGFFPILSAGGFLAGMFVIMLRLDWQLTLLALIVCPVLFIAISLLNGRINSAARSASQQESEVYSVVQRAMSAMRVIQAFSKEEDEHRKFMKTSGESMAAKLRLYTLQTLYGGTVHVVIALGTALVLWVGARHVLSGTLTAGELIVFISYLASLYNPISNLVQTYGLTQGAKVGVKRVFDILDVDRDIKDGFRAFPSSGSRGEVIFSQLSFQYLPGKPVLKNINLHVEPGKTVAIVGSTGAGKSTLVSFLPRFYDSQTGRVLIDGVDVREFRLKDLRQQIAMVLQPALVFPFTIRENIAYGRPEASLEEVVSAARVARIHDFIEQLPQGYDTVVGEQGANLSEGERLRLTIARGILLNAPILILDEPTSSVDSETEALIMEGLEHLMAGRTTFIIAHRLSTVRQADLIVVLRGGEIVEQGNFFELIRAHGPFASLYRTQFGLYEEARNLRLVK